MSVIAWDGTTLAADRLVTTAGRKDYITKIERIGPLLCGGVGDPYLVAQMGTWIARAWVHADRDGDAWSGHRSFPLGQIEDGSEYIVIDQRVAHQKASILVFEKGPTPVVLHGIHVAIGSGAMAARAAMLCGKDAVEAVEISMQVDSSCGGHPIDALRFVACE